MLFVHKVHMKKAVMV